MISTVSLPSNYQSLVTNGSQELTSDAPVGKGGAGEGFGAHELLEAALATCVNMAVRMHADREGYPLDTAATTVRIVRPTNDEVRFEYSLDLVGALADAQRQALYAVAERCPVRQPLSKSLDCARVRPLHIATFLNGRLQLLRPTAPTDMSAVAR